jgi:hypothetical protein
MLIDTLKKIFYALILIVSFSGCSPKISQNFQNNRYINNYSLHIINDSLGIYFKTPADIDFVRSRKELKKIIQHSSIDFQNKILAYGRTNFPPYEFFVTIGNRNFSDDNKNLIVFDTVSRGKRIHFIGNPLNQSSANPLRNDLAATFNSLEIGEGYRKNITSVMEIVRKYNESNKFYYALDQIQQFPAYDKAEEWTKFQMEITYASFLGENLIYKELLDQYEANYTPQDSVKNKIGKAALFNTEAINSIIEEAGRHKVVMINENHFYPNHRLLLLEILPKLKEIGYNKLALEGLGDNQDSILNQEGGYPTLKTGFYTSEQNFSNLIREAKSLGYEFVAYDDISAKNREVSQAKNLFEKTLEKHPRDKVLVLAGIAHILEKPTKNGNSRMATVLKSQYKIDPLTISQTHLSYYRKYFDEDYILLSSNDLSDYRLRSVDYHLLNNKSLDFSLWESNFKYKNEHDFDVQVALFYASELLYKTDYHNKVPYFTTIVKKGETVNLPVKSGKEIYLYSYDKNGNRIDKTVLGSSGNS